MDFRCSVLLSDSILCAPPSGGGSSSLRRHRAPLALSWLLFLCAVTVTMSTLPAYASGVAEEQVSQVLPIKKASNTAWWVLVALLGLTGFSALHLGRYKIATALEGLERLPVQLGRGWEEELGPIQRENGRIKAWVVRQRVFLATIFLLAVALHFHALYFESKAFNGFLNASGIYWLMITLLTDLQFTNLTLILVRNLRLLGEWAQSALRTRCRPRGKGGGSEVISVSFPEPRTRKLSSSVIIASLAEQCLYQRRLAKNVNKIFSLFLLVQVPSNLIQVIFHFYYYTEILLGVGHIESIPYNVAEVLVWSTSYIYGLSAVISACHAATEQEERLHYFVADNLAKVDEMEALRKLRLFSSQLYLTPLKFEAYGFFTLDYPLLVTVAAVVVSQLVVLVQFKQSSLSQN